MPKIVHPPPPLALTSPDEAALAGILRAAADLVDLAHAESTATEPLFDPPNTLLMSLSRSVCTVSCLDRRYFQHLDNESPPSHPVQAQILALAQRLIEAGVTELNLRGGSFVLRGPRLLPGGFGVTAVVAAHIDDTPALVPTIEALDVPVHANARERVALRRFALRHLALGQSCLLRLDVPARAKAFSAEASAHEILELYAAAAPTAPVAFAALRNELATLYGLTPVATILTRHTRIATAVILALTGTRANPFSSLRAIPLDPPHPDEGALRIPRQGGVW